MLNTNRIATLAGSPARAVGAVMPAPGKPLDRSRPRAESIRLSGLRGATPHVG